VLPMLWTRAGREGGEVAAGRRRKCCSRLSTNSGNEGGKRVV